MLSLVSSTQSIWRQTTSRTEQFREARRAFERISQRLSQATLNVYWDYVNSAGQPRTTNNAATFEPARYARFSELRYLQTNAAALPAPRGGQLRSQAVFFQAALGKTVNTNLTPLNSLLNTVGYFIEQGDDSLLKPAFVPGTRTRYRLFEMVEPSEDLELYRVTSGSPFSGSSTWFTVPLGERKNSHRLADNIVALVLGAVYEQNNATVTNFAYQSTPAAGGTQPPEANNLPPSVRVSMVALDEPSARRVQDSGLNLPNATDDNSLAELEEFLRENSLNYRRFESSIPIASSKWSTE